MEQSKRYFMVMNFLLLLLVVMNVVQLLNYYNSERSDFERFNQVQDCYKSQLSRIDAWILNIEDEISFMNENYDKDVYNNKKIDTVLQQQLLSSGYNLVAIQKLYVYNIKVLDILARISVCGGYK